jgi:predicted transcriptional regulator
MTKPDSRTGRRHAEHGTVNSKHIVSFNVGDELFDRLNTIADKQEVTRATVIRAACENWLKRYGF